MARLGPWDGARRVAVAVSGGADSLALALLAQDWGDPVALVVDHKLRPAAAAEAEWTRATLLARGIPATILRLDGLTPGPGVAARARRARYAALSAACRAAGLVDLLLGHHAGDQAETVLMRRRGQSGPDGLAGMAACVVTEDVRLLRPLLAFDPARLRAMAAAAGLTPVEDPTNTDLRTTRARLRREIGADRAALLAAASEAGAARAMAEAEAAAELAARAEIRPERFAVLSPGPLDPAQPRRPAPQPVRAALSGGLGCAPCRRTAGRDAGGRPTAAGGPAWPGLAAGAGGRGAGTAGSRRSGRRLGRALPRRGSGAGPHGGGARGSGGGIPAPLRPAVRRAGGAAGRVGRHRAIGCARFGLW